jgi:hypothetical protein
VLLLLLLLLVDDVEQIYALCSDLSFPVCVLFAVTCVCITCVNRHMYRLLSVEGSEPSCNQLESGLSTMGKRAQLQSALKVTKKAKCADESNEADTAAAIDAEAAAADAAAPAVANVTVKQERVDHLANMNDRKQQQSMLSSLRFKVDHNKKKQSEHGNMAMTALDLYNSLSSCKKKDFIKQYVLNGGMKGLKWVGSFSSTSDSVQSTTTGSTSGMCTRHEILKMNGLEISSMNDELQEELLTALLEESEAEFAHIRTEKGSKHPLLTRYLYKKRNNAEETDTTSLTQSLKMEGEMSASNLASTAGSSVAIELSPLASKKLEVKKLTTRLAAMKKTIDNNLSMGRDMLAEIEVAQDTNELVKPFVGELAKVTVAMELFVVEARALLFSKGIDDTEYAWQAKHDHLDETVKLAAAHVDGYRIMSKKIKALLGKD